MKKICFLCLLLLFLVGCGRVQNTSTVHEPVVSGREIYEEDEVASEIKKFNLEEDENVFKKSFILVTDFIFYDGEIHGKKFGDLKETSKNQILEAYQEMQRRMEQYYPGYQEDLSKKTKNSYELLYEKTILLRNKIIEEYQEYIGEDNYQNMIDSYEEGKDSLQDVYQEYKPKVVDEYEEMKEKFSSWYQEYKES